ncbi:cation diffusion facilitator family transporter KNAG_0D00930 [Huiozyma naganishii CBS 8797]|uniref:Cation efflux protein transmembrane domain-containing protein n=1 Tax=Huiozyma naganishii (strain ATCC MYA-139 / BCRC 22969 / CBS 8797 / KCTC 17520 / NBRC 10181 / NCYC 3082 / Yp74L-3) TaxID=1071383 RepID=J7R4S5_HUIN7|nr:hypothetical protein KNAG_0D00930 [Kazachstania naganishii CBS 8797]CCK69845.1 hypothetical protein KNAG_0D00930 [Kazachstania naganishii CBS 8797]
MLKVKHRISSYPNVAKSVGFTVIKSNSKICGLRIKVSTVKIRPFSAVYYNKQGNKSQLDFSTSGSMTDKDVHRKPLTTDFSSHEHIHLQQSESEQNDSFTLDGEHHAKTFSKPAHPTLSHSHSHSHSHSYGEVNPLLVLSSKEIKKNPGVRITWIGLAINVGIALGKFVGGIVFHSQALLADSVHAASDLVSDVLTLVSVRWATSKPTKEYPYGHGKIETVGSLAVSTILAMAGVSIGWSSLCAVVGPIIPHTILETLSAYIGSHSHSHSHGVTEGVTNINAAWIAGGSIVLKEWIFQATKKIAIQSNSNVLLANAWHHRVDSLTSLVALVAITSSHFFNVQSLDAIGGLLVSGLVIKAGGEGMIESMKELIDQSLPHTNEQYLKIDTVLKDSLAKLVSNNNSNKPYKIKELVVLQSGRNYRISVVLEAPKQKWDNVLGIDEMTNVTKYVRNMLKREVNNIGKLEVEFVQEGSTVDNGDTFQDNRNDKNHAHTHTENSADQHNHHSH